MPMAENASEKAMSTGMVTVCARTTTYGCPERLALRVLVGIFLSLVHLLFKLFSLLLVTEGQPSQAILKLKCMEKYTILVVRESIVYFLVPYDATVRR